MEVGNRKRKSKTKYKNEDLEFEHHQFGQIHLRTISAMTVSACGTTIYTGSGDKTIKTVSIKERKVLHDWGECHAATIKTMVVTKDGSKLFTGGYGSQLKVWNPHTRELIKELDNAHEGNIQAVTPSYITRQHNFC